MTRSDPRATIIVPGFDVEPYAREALDSLRAQTFTRWRAILVDDASTDGTSAVFAQAAAADSRFEVVSHPRRAGLSAARNTGLDLVDTPYVGFLDADDVMTPGALARAVETLSGSGSDFVVGAYVRLRPSGPHAYAPDEVQPWVSAATDPARTGTTIDRHPEATGNIVAWSKLSRIDFWQRAGLRFPEGRLYEDQVVAQTMYARARVFDVIPDVLVQWRVRADGSSITQREADLDVLRACLSAMTDGLDVLQEAGRLAAHRARTGQILRMDVPRLALLAEAHPDPTYRRELGAFVRSVLGRAAQPGERGDHRLDDGAARAVDTALRW